MPAGVVVVGSGVAGVHTANSLARNLPPSEATIRVIDSNGQHAYQPGWLSVALDSGKASRLSRDVRALLHPRVELVLDEVTRLDPTAGKLWLSREGTMSYDYAVLATGTRLDRDAVPGLRGGLPRLLLPGGCQTPPGGTPQVRRWNHPGRDRRGPLSLSSCPSRVRPPPRRGNSADGAFVSSTQIRYLSPLNRAFPIESASEVIEPILEERGIEMVPFVNVEEVDPSKHELFSLEGETFSYDLAVLVPPHRGSRLVGDSGLGDPGGWIPTDPATLQVRGYSRLFALGDGTDLPISKAGSTAHFESAVVAEQISAAIEGRGPDPKTGTFRGRVVCFLGVGGKKTAMIQLHADHAPNVGGPSRFWHLVRWLFEKTYWITLKTGLGFRAERFLPRG